MYAAIDLPKNIKTQVQRLFVGLPDAQWVEPEGLCLIIRDFGKVEGTLLLDIKECLEKIVFPPFSISLEGIGHQHSKGRGIIHAKAAPSENLDRFAKMIQRSTEDLDILPVPKGFAPHVIIGRYSGLSPARICTYLEATFAFCTPEFIVEGFSLMSYRTTQKRTFFVEEARFKLAI